MDKFFLFFGILPECGYIALTVIGMFIVFAIGMGIAMIVLFKILQEVCKQHDTK